MLMAAEFCLWKIFILDILNIPYKKILLEFLMSIK